MRRPWPFMVQQRSWAEQASDCLPTQEQSLNDWLSEEYTPMPPQKHRPPESIPDPFQEKS